ncbi:MAG: HupE/UreJ family protein [Oculatellaceae cyanobacterium Prado106]|jgi:urease accessory protein|nr:HupE/UreJ family protein [Oculatellaceae cyanobacterium Prado106]
MTHQKFFGNGSLSNPVKQGLVVTTVLVSSLGLALPAFAHHAMGGNLPTTIAQGFFSGLAHPIIGIDHFAFVIGLGLLAAFTRQGFWVPVTALLGMLVGTGLHLLQWNLPLPEVMIATSVLLLGVLLACQPRLHWDAPQWGLIISLATIAGLFHGYAYGEAIVGAGMVPLLAYLVGFTSVQLAIALTALVIGQSLLKRIVDQPPLPIRFAGFILCGIGATILSNVITGMLFNA